MTFILAFLIIITLSPLYGSELISVDDIPNPKDAAKMARYVIHNSDWAGIATISRNSKIPTYPFVSLESISDGPKNNGSGKVYFYVTVKDEFHKDITVDNRVSIITTLAESSYCSHNNLDPEDPRCARVMMSGEFGAVNKEISPEEYDFARMSIFERHPIMRFWPVDHDWYFGAIQNISSILIFDAFGGVKAVNVEDYFKANVTSYDSELNFNEV